MGIIEQAARRLEELRRAGVEVPWAAAGLSEAKFQALSEASNAQGPAREAVMRPTPGTAAAAANAPGTGRRSRQVELDLEKMRRAGFLVPAQPRSGLADEFRVIKRPLIRNAQGPCDPPLARANLILVTSALPGEGKTFTAVNLALSIAMELDKTVLLVDADVVRSSLMERMGLETARGLLDVLTDASIDLPDVLLKTNIPKLALLPAGSPCINATELLASAAMEQLLDEFSTRYPDRIVVFDAPPLLSNTECRVLAGRVGQVLMVVAAEQTPHSAVARAFDTVESCPMVMSVLNKRRGGAATDGDYGD